MDIVVPNAGVTEGVPFDHVNLVDGRPIKPKLTTLDVNLTGVVYCEFRLGPVSIAQLTNLVRACQLSIWHCTTSS